VERNISYKPIQYLDQSRLHRNIDYQEYAPSQGLAKYVSCYWTFYTREDVHHESHRILPDGCIDLIFDFKTGSSLISGIANETAHLVLNGSYKTMGVRFLPGAIPFILRSDASEFLNNGFETGFATGALKGIADKIFDLDGEYGILKKIDNELVFFFRDFHADRRFSGILDHALKSRGCLNVRDLAGYHSLSEKQITRYFKRYVGLSTKEFLQIIRFQNAISLMKDVRSSRILRHSPEIGYYDQSHLLRDLKKYFGDSENYF
jgi:AraC-like DNA-binding protein